MPRLNCDVKGLVNNFISSPILLFGRWSKIYYNLYKEKTIHCLKKFPDMRTYL